MYIVKDEKVIGSKMSTEEAVKILEAEKSKIEWDYPMDFSVAFDMAIKTLKNSNK